jgi:hypothetical protein
MIAILPVGELALYARADESRPSKRSVSEQSAGDEIDGPRLWPLIADGSELAVIKIHTAQATLRPQFWKFIGRLSAQTTIAGVRN